MSEHLGEQLKALIASELNRSPESIRMDHDFVNDLQADSIDTANILNAINTTFNVLITADTAENFQTVEELINYVLAQLERRQVGQG